MLKIFKNQKGQIISTELIIILAIAVSIAISVVFALGDSAADVDKGYQTEVKGFFMQGE